MRCIFFTKFPPPYTGQTIGTEIFAGMAENRCHVDRIDTSFGSIKPGTLGLDWLVYNAQFSAQLLRKLSRLQSLLQSHNYDRLYFVASPSLMGHVRDLLTVTLARSHVDRIVIHVHNGNFNSLYQKGVTSYTASFLANRVDNFVFSSAFLSEELSDSIPEFKRSVVHNTVDEDVRCNRSRVDEKIDHRASRSIFRVLFLSNMIPSKGYQDVVEAARQLVKGGGGGAVQFDFVGDWKDASLRRDLEAFIAKHQIADWVKIHGRVTNRELVREFLINADVFVLPTYYPIEAQPFSIIEAMNAGTPIIATPHASIPEYVEDDHNGYLVSKKAPAEIATAIRRLMDTENWSEKAKAARKTYERKFSPEAVQDQFFTALSLE